MFIHTKQDCNPRMDNGTIPWEGPTEVMSNSRFVSPFVRIILLLFISFGLKTPLLLAQFESGTVLGTVHDPSGAAVPAAAVTLTNVQTGIVVHGTADANGDYEFVNQRLGKYRVRVEVSGFQTSETDPFDLAVNARQRIDVTLQVGHAEEFVKVTDAAALLETDTSSRGQLINPTQIVELPLNGRSYADLTLLTPGVAKSPLENGTDSSRDASYHVNGGRSELNNFLLDGIDNNAYGTSNQGFSNQVIQPNPDALAEFKVETNNYSAEFGRATGAVINATIKSGTNQFHGEAWEFLRNTDLNAVGFFKPVGGGTLPFNQNQFGGAAGGPILKQKMFFFADYEGFRRVSHLLQFATVPTADSDIPGQTTPGRSEADILTRMATHKLVLFAAVMLSIAAAAVSTPTADNARMNQVQVLGSHNSYKLAIDPSLLSLLKKGGDKRFDALEYSHVPIERQLDMGLRALEIDVVYDPQGGRYSHPKGIDLVAENHLPPGAPYDPYGEMKKPGFKVMHIPDIDFRTNAYTFQQELALLKAWSNAHPHHLPIPITMNAKDDGVKRPGFTALLKFDKAAFDAWDAEILAGLGRDRVITPDDVRGNYPTLEQAVLAQAWPTLGSARGKFFFVLDETGQKLDTYVEGHPSLRGRVMFTNSTEGHPEAAFRIVNEAQRDAAYIQYLVRSGYYVRTRADSDTVEARKGDYTRWQQALISGAQVISTDYYVPDPAFGTGYHVQLPGGQAGRWNPLLLPDDWPLPAIE